MEEPANADRLGLIAALLLAYYMYNITTSHEPLLWLEARTLVTASCTFDEKRGSKTRLSSIFSTPLQVQLHDSSGSTEAYAGCRLLRLLRLSVRCTEQPMLAVRPRKRCHSSSNSLLVILQRASRASEQFHARPGLETIGRGYVGLLASLELLLFDMALRLEPWRALNR